MAKAAVKEKVKPVEKKKASKIEEDAVGTAVSNFYAEQIELVEKKYRLSGSSGAHVERFSSGSLVLDLIMGGGYYPGRWYTHLGLEASGKSTALMSTMAHSLDMNVPYRFMWDYEGSMDWGYFSQMLLKPKSQPEMFGVKNDQGKYVKRGLVNYYDEDVAEVFFDSMGSLLRKTPRKLWVPERKAWYLVFENSKEFAQFKEHADRKLSDGEHLYVPAPDGLPQALIFLDSYPAMLPEGLDEDDKKSGMAAQARMFSEKLKLVKPKLRRRHCSVIGVNGIRLRPGVSFGCLHYNTPIHFVDGRVIPIGQVVEKKIEGQIWSLNEKTQNLEARDITGWHNNGLVQQDGWLKITTQGINTNAGTVAAMVTPNHEILTEDGWKEAAELTTDDYVVTKYVSTFNGTRAQFLAGVLSGDSCLVPDKRSTNTALRLQCSVDLEYVEWKMKMLGGEWKSSTDSRGFTCHVLKPSYEFTELREFVDERDPTRLAEHITPMSLAIMYMDDGHYDSSRDRCFINFKRFAGKRKKMYDIAALFEKFGLNPSVHVNTGTIQFKRETIADFHSLIAPFVPKCMARKMRVPVNAKYKLHHVEMTKTVYASVLKIEPAGERNYRATTTSRHKGLYDITVAKNHNYLAGSGGNGFIVHNSPEYEPCGEAIKFVSDCRVRFNAVGVPKHCVGQGALAEERSISEEGTDQYRYSTLKTRKNKMGPNFMEGYLRIWQADEHGKGHGIDPVFDTWQYLRLTGWCKGSMKKMELTVPNTERTLKLDWMGLKKLVLCKGQELKDVHKSLRLKEPVHLRRECFKLLKSGDAVKHYFETQSNGGDDE